MTRFKFIKVFILSGVLSNPVLTQAAIFGGDKALKQNNLCNVTTPQEIMSQCTDGDILLYTPDVFGNEQLPINVAGFMCDFNYPIVWNIGGVSCVFTSARKASW
mgnify:CR=1 FL=1